MSKRKIWGAVVLGFVALFSAYGMYLVQDIPPFDDSDMSVSPIILKDEENAYFDLLAIEKTIYYPEEKKELIEKMAIGESWDQTFADELIAKNRDALASFQNMVTRKGYQNPELQGSQADFGFDTPVGPITKARNIAQEDIVLAREYLKKGKMEDSMKIALNCAKIGGILQNSPRSTMIGYLIGMSIKKTALDFLKENAYQYTISFGKEFVDELDQFKQNTFGIKESFRGEYQLMRNTFLSKEASFDDAVTDSGIIGVFGSDPIKVPFFRIQFTMIHSSILHRFYFNERRTLRLLYDRSKDGMHILDLPCAQVFPKEDYPVALRTNFPIFRKNVLGEGVLVATSGGAHLYERRCEDSFLVLQTQLALAVNVYKADNGAYPKNLEALAPKYLESIPKEFAGRPIEYDSETGKISDMKDFY